MSGLYPLSARYDDGARPNRIARAAAEALFERMQDGGYSERELCTLAGVTRRTWRGVTGRPYPTDPEGGRSLISLRDFIAICNYLHFDPAHLLRELLDTDGRLPKPPKDDRPTIMPIVERRKSKQELRAEAEAAVASFGALPAGKRTET